MNLLSSQDTVLSVMEKLKKWDMSDYEATIYLTLIRLRMGTARDLHEMTGIPRGRVYETVHSLKEKGFIDVTGANPCQYRALDIRPTFERIKKKIFLTLDEILDDLEDIEENTSSLHLPCYRLKNEWAINNQISGLIRRVKARIIIFCRDPDWYAQFRDDFKLLSRRVDLYLVVEDPSVFTQAGVRLYTGDQLIRSFIFNLSKVDAPSSHLVSVLFADEYDKMMIFRDDGKESGLCSSSFLLTGFISRCILERITPVG